MLRKTTRSLEWRSDTIVHQVLRMAGSPVLHLPHRLFVRRGSSVARTKHERKPRAPKVESSLEKIGEEYKKIEPQEHVLLRPDMYIGAVSKTSDEMWVFRPKRGLVLETIQYVPGLYKIFDEILVNAADNYQRDRSQSTIRVDISAENNTISVFNDGRGIPVVIHPEHQRYIPEMIFGELLTGSNFDDLTLKVTGGRNGLGSKLANIYSKEFIVETSHGESGRKYRQVFSNNMTVKSEPEISACGASENWTRITFKPDLEKFGMKVLDRDIVALMSKRVLDVAGCNSDLQVYLNGELLSMPSFEAFAKRFHSDFQGDFITMSRDVNGRNKFELIVTAGDGDFEQISFVNSIWTIRGGSHVQCVVDQILEYLRPILKSKNKGEEVKPVIIRSGLRVFLNTLLPNPAFDSQTKETLKTRASEFEKTLQLSDAFLKRLEKSDIVEKILETAQMKSKKAVMKQGGIKKKHVVGVEKLVDANFAGGRYAQDCTLILTEGDSAKALAIAGMSVVGRDKYGTMGVFPLRGKLINVRDASETAAFANEEVKAIVQILGLKPHMKYSDVKPLRYGSVMIMTDQDYDGSHIKGLILNLFHAFWPELLQIDGFMTEFITPIVKLSKANQTKSFFTVPEYERFLTSTDSNGWKIKYYKGLGTSTSAEAREYFSDLRRHKKTFVFNGNIDNTAISMAFGKTTLSSKSADQRKDWILSYESGTFLDHSGETVSYNDFVHKELVLYSIANCQRAIPSVIDGLKPGQRKILFASFKRKLFNEIRVAQLSGYVSEVAAYHHGESSLQSTIVGMAQTFVGSNNINLLHPQGQFGTRLEGGKDAASARYIHTFLSSLTRLLFPPADDPTLTYLIEDGLSIEPETYFPIIPFVLMNGMKGIGTGWSSSIPSYNPIDVIKQIRNLLDRKPLEIIHPWYRGFNGSIELQQGSDSYKVEGKWQRLSDSAIEVLELPIGVWTQSFKVKLDTLLANQTITDYDDYSTESKVHFCITFPNLSSPSEAQIEKILGLSTTLSLNNMHFFDGNGKIVKYSSISEIINEFYPIRLKQYARRKAHLVRSLEEEYQRLLTQMKFISAVIDGTLRLENRKKSDILEDITKMNISSMTNQSIDGTSTLDFLLGMKLSALTEENVSKLKVRCEETSLELEELKRKEVEDLWRIDLDLLEKGWLEYEGSQALSYDQRRKVTTKV